MYMACCLKSQPVPGDSHETTTGNEVYLVYSPSRHMLRSDFVGAKPTLDSACTARFMVSGIVSRRWRDFSLIPPEHGGRGLIRFGVTPPLPLVGD